MVETYTGINVESEIQKSAPARSKSGIFLTTGDFKDSGHFNLVLPGQYFPSTFIIPLFPQFWHETIISFSSGLKLYLLIIC